jgi:hypothetical protein
MKPFFILVLALALASVTATALAAVTVHPTSAVAADYSGATW